MRILFVVSGTRRVAATRYRVYQYLDYLKMHGVKCGVFSTLSDFLTGLSIRSPELQTGFRVIYYMLYFIERFFRFAYVLFAAFRYDILFLQRATFPFGLAYFLKLSRRPVIFDIDDAIFMPDTTDGNWLNKLKGVIKESEVKASLAVSKAVIVENEYIKEYVERFCKDVYKIPGPIDTIRYFAPKAKKKDYPEEIIIGWIGSPATTAYLKMLDNVFSRILAEFEDARIMLIGAGNYGSPNERVVKVKWEYETEVGYLQMFDIGVMPMPDDQWTKGKLGCKMLQYMAVGAPAVVSYTSTNAEVIKDGENGCFARNESEWLLILRRLIKDAPLRRKIGEKGRKTVHDLCSLTENAPRLLDILKRYNAKP